ncbi:aminoglycoside phosphotransferase family protein [Spartinivicinus poritis]|uniref:Phosphotransferase n=1 Tax=Spartinivicinus poritis TaxID=2994640 RepID=A0ABT5UB56_9GAMM|nr:phosphotransferase [Spartinivicinus sp. A2-2]MDE1463216.1 phosphotransferase [Spartinivicinus sp. A2-2]
MNIRRQVLSNWLKQVLPTIECQFNWHHTNHQVSLVLLYGDASFRKYYRIQPGTDCTLIAVDAPPKFEDCKAFIDISEYLSKKNVKVPKVYAHDISNGFLLLEDLGDTLLLDQLNQSLATDLYQQAVTEMAKFQTAQVPNGLTIPSYDDAFLMREMDLLEPWFFEKLLNISLDRATVEAVNAVKQRIISEVLSQPMTCVHRDYHSRNLMVWQQQLAVIDFQGMVWGPACYDLASLYKDCYIRWSREQVLAWLEQAAQQLPLLQPYSFEEVVKWFDWTGLQRHLKVLGLFARLAIRDKKNRYLTDLPVVIGYVMEVVAQYEELAALKQLFTEILLPKLFTQPWFQPEVLQEPLDIS